MNIDNDTFISSDVFKAMPVVGVTASSYVTNPPSEGRLTNLLNSLEDGLGNGIGRVRGELLNVAENKGAVNSSMLMLQLKVSEHAYAMSIASGVASSARQSLQSLLQNG